MTDAAPDTEAVQRLLALDLGENEAEAPTLREYLTELLKVAWTCGDDLKRAFGTSGWRRGDVYTPMFRAGLVDGAWHGDPDDEEDGWLERVDEAKAEELVLAAIDALSGVPSKAPSTVTVVTDDNRLERWHANGIDTENGELIVGTGKDGIDDVVAVYAQGRWARAAEDGKALATGPDRSARVAELEAALRQAREIASGCGTDGGTPFTAICDIADRALGE